MTSLRTRLAVLGTSLALAATSGPVLGVALAAPASASVALPRGISELIEDGTPSGRAIATFDAVPTASQVGALRALGITVQPMQSLPLAIVSGKVADLTTAVTRGLAIDVYPDERIKLLDTASSNAMSARSLRPRPCGPRASPARASPSASSTPAATPPIPTWRNAWSTTSSWSAPSTPTSSRTPRRRWSSPRPGPTQNTDLGSGHGTHVAGHRRCRPSSAADGSHFGVAPGAKPRVLRHRPGAVHDRGGDGVRLHAEPARHAGASTWSTTPGATPSGSSTRTTRSPW